MVTYYVIEDNSLKPISADLATDYLKKGKEKVWIDAIGDNEAELEDWLNKLNVKGVARFMLTESNQYAGVYPLKREAVFIVPALLSNSGQNKRMYMVSYIAKNVLFTWHAKALYDANYLKESVDDSDSWLVDDSAASLFSSILVDLAQSCYRRTMDMREELFQLQSRHKADPESVLHQDVQDLEQRVLNCGLILSEQLPVIKGLLQIDNDYLNQKDASTMANCALVIAQSADSMISWLENRLTSIEQSIEYFQQERTNNRLGKITILSAIFMPMTFLAGVWGMNFNNMPELNRPFGYVWALGTMAIIGLLMYLFFKRHGWVKKT